MISAGASRFVSLLFAILLVTTVFAPVQAGTDTATSLDAEEQTIVGGLVEVNETHVAGVRVTSDQGASDTTDAGGQYEFSVPAVEQNLTADAFGYANVTKTVTPNASKSVTIVPFSLDEPIVEAQTMAAPEYVPAGDVVRITHRVANANVTTVSIANSTNDAPSNASLRINGFNASFGEQVFVGSAETVTVTIATEADQFGSFTLEQQFSASFDRNRTTSTTTGPIKVHPETVVVPDDVDPGQPAEQPYTDLQAVLEFVTPETTVALNHSRFAIEPTTANGTVALALERPITLTATPEAAPVLAVTNSSVGDTTTGIEATADNVTISGLELRGNGTETGIRAAGSTLTIRNSTLRNTTTGVAVTAGTASITDNRFTALAVGVRVRPGGGTTPPGTVVENNTFDDDGTLETSIVDAAGAIERIQHNTIHGGETGIRVSNASASIATTVRENELTNTSDTALAVVDSHTQTIEQNQITESGNGIVLHDTNRTTLSGNSVEEAGILLRNATDTFGGDNRVQNSSTGVLVAAGSRNTTLIDSTAANVTTAVRIAGGSTGTTVRGLAVTNADGTVAFGTVDPGANTVTDLVLAGQGPLTVSGSNATLAVNRSPPARPLEGLGPVLELQATGSSPVLSTEIGYTDGAVEGIDEATLQLYTYNGSWTAVDGSSVNTGNQFVSGTITDAGPFAPLGEAGSTGGSTGDGSDDDGGSSGGSTGGDNSDDDDNGGGSIGGGYRPVPPRDDDGNDEDGDSSPGTDRPVPKAVIDVRPEQAIVDREVVFSATNSTIDGSLIGAYDWTIAGEQFDGETVTTTFYEPGEIDVELTVTSVNNEQNTTTTTVTVEPPGDDDGDADEGESAEDRDRDAGGDADSGGSSIPGFGSLVAVLGLYLGLKSRQWRCSG